MFANILKLDSHPKGLSEGTIQEVSAYCREHFGTPLPADYAAFLRESNGFLYEDQSIFCCYTPEIRDFFPQYAYFDLVTFNTDFYETTDITSYLMLGSSSLDYVCYEKASGKYLIVTNGTMEIMEESSRFAELLALFFEP